MKSVKSAAGKGELKACSASEGVSHEGSRRFSSQQEVGLCVNPALCSSRWHYLKTPMQIRASSLLGSVGGSEGSLNDAGTRTGYLASFAERRGNCSPRMPP